MLTPARVADISAREQGRTAAAGTALLYLLLVSPLPSPLHSESINSPPQPPLRPTATRLISHYDFFSPIDPRSHLTALPRRPAGPQAVLVMWVVQWAPRPGGLNAPLAEFSEGRAMRHVEVLAAGIGQRQVSTASLARARDYLHRQLLGLQADADAVGGVAVEVDLQTVNGAVNMVFCHEVQPRPCSQLSSAGMQLPNWEGGGGGGTVGPFAQRSKFPSLATSQPA